MSSEVAKAIARYLVSALDLTTTLCFLLFQDIKSPLINTISRSGASVYGRACPVYITIYYFNVLSNFHEEGVQNATVRKL